MRWWKALPVFRKAISGGHDHRGAASHQGAVDQRQAVVAARSLLPRAVDAGPNAFTYQWSADGVLFEGATARRR